MLGINIPKLADLVAAVVVLSLPLFIGVVILALPGATLVPVTMPWFGLYAFVVLMSATKLYGKKIFDAVKKVGGGYLEMQRQQEQEQVINNNGS